MDQVRQAQLDLAQTAKKKVATTALITLREILAAGPSARANAAALRDNRLRAVHEGENSAPTWDSVLNRVLFHLANSNKLTKADVEKLRLLVGAALGSGEDALSSKMEIKVFCYVCLELADVKKTPPRADKTSAHPDCIGVLLQLASARPQLLARLTPRRLRAILETCMGWITGDQGEVANGDGDAGMDDLGSTAAAASGVAKSGPHESVAALPQLMMQYAQLLHSIVVAWVADMPVLEPGHHVDDGGPFFTMLNFLSRVCERRPPHLSKMANLLWSATLHAILAHGPNALHEIAAFGLEPPVHKTLLAEWNAERGAALADTCAAFVRVHLSCLHLCAMRLPASYSRQLSRLMFDELSHSPAFKRPANLLHANDISEETWRARSLLQLITDVFALHRQTSPPDGAAGGGGGKRHKTAASMPLDQQLVDAICQPSTSTDVLQRWLLLLGSLCERHPAALAPSLRSALVAALASHLPTADSSIGNWYRMPLLAWCLGNLAAIEPLGAAHADWGVAWSQLHALAALFAPTATNTSRGAGGAGGAPGGGWERGCFVDLAARAMRLVLTQRLLPPDALATAIGTFHTSPLFAPHRSATAAADAGDDDEPASTEGTYLLSIVELAVELCKVTDRASTEGVVSSDDCALGGGGHGAGRHRMICWLCERIFWTPAQPAFESTSPWKCALQLRAQQAAAAGENAHLLLRAAFCGAVVRNAPWRGPLADGWRSSRPSEGIEAAPPIPAPWLRRLAPPALAPDEDEFGGDVADWSGDSDSSDDALLTRMLSPGLLQLETFLRHVESLSSAAAAPKVTTVGEPSPDASLGRVETSWSNVLGAGALAEEEESAESGAMLELALLSLQGRLRQVVGACPGESAGVGNQETLRSMAHALRVAEWTAELMLAAGPSSAPSGCLKLIQKALRNVASWMRRTLPAAPPAGAMAVTDLGAAKVWVRAHRMLLALRSCLLSFAALVSDGRGVAAKGWASFAPSWPEPLYVGMVSEPLTLIQGIQLLCGMLAQQKQGFVATGTGAAAFGGGGGATSRAARQARVDDVDAMDFEFESEPVDVDASSAASTSQPVGADGGGQSAISTESDGSGALHVILECVDLWALSDGQTGSRLLAGLPRALEHIGCAQLRTQMLALRTLSTCIRATPQLQNANRQPRTLLSSSNGSSAIAGAMSNGELAEAAQPWNKPAKALLAEAKTRLLKAASRVRKIKLDSHGVDSAAGVEASVAAAAATCDCHLRRALAIVATFARSVPAILPLGGSAVELQAYNELWQLIIGSEDSDAKAVAAERGGHTLIVRDMQRMLPLTPAARLALVDALHAHVTMHARLHDSLRRFRNPSRPQARNACSPPHLPHVYSDTHACSPPSFRTMTCPFSTAPRSTQRWSASTTRSSTGWATASGPCATLPSPRSRPL